MYMIGHFTKLSGVLMAASLMMTKEARQLVVIMSVCSHGVGDILVMIVLKCLNNTAGD